MKWSLPKELLVVVAIGLGIAVFGLNEQWSDAERRKEEAVASKSAAELAAKAGLEQSAVMKSAKDAAESALQAAKDQMATLQKAVDAANAAVKAAQDQAKQAISARDAAESTARAGQELVTQAQAAKQTAERELAELRNQLKDLKDKAARDVTEKTAPPAATASTDQPNADAKPAQ